VARRITRNTLLAWGLADLAADAETIVGELAANAVTHGAALECGGLSAEPPGLRLLRRAAEVICAVLDASGALPALRPPGAAAGRHAISQGQYPIRGSRRAELRGTPACHTGRRSDGAAMSCLPIASAGSQTGSGAN
jgi:hypothetical protein